jgi:hypothetical protein
MAGVTSAPGVSGTATLTLGEVVSGDLGTADTHDDYTFGAAAGAVVYGHSEGDCVDGLQWVLLAPDHSLLGMGPRTCQELGRVVLPANGTYTVSVRSNGPASGAYRFVLSAVPPTTVDALTLDQVVTGSLDSPGQWHDYTFAAAAGQKIVVQASGTCPDHLAWNLLRPDGTLLDFHVACGTMGPDSIAASGTYTVRLLGDAAATGDYGFKVSAAP